MEILTDSGWAKVCDVSGGDCVLTFNRDTFEYQYQKSNMVALEFDGELLECKHKNVRFIVTPDHRMVASKQYKGDNYDVYGFVEAIEFVKSDNNWGFRVPKYFHSDGVLPGWDWEPKEAFIVVDDWRYVQGNEKKFLAGKTL